MEKEVINYVRKNKMFKNQVVVFTGFRDEEMKRFIEVEGGVVKNSMVNGTTLLITKNLSFTSSKIVQANKRGIEMMSREYAQDYMQGIRRVDFNGNSVATQEEVDTLFKIAAPTQEDYSAFLRSSGTEASSVANVNYGFLAESVREGSFGFRTDGNVGTPVPTNKLNVETSNVVNISRNGRRKIRYGKK